MQLNVHRLHMTKNGNESKKSGRKADNELEKDYWKESRRDGEEQGKRKKGKALSEVCHPLFSPHKRCI